MSSELIKTKIDGLLIKKLKLIPDERGFLMECMRNDDSFFSKFGQVYISGVYPGVVKGWHYHKEQTDNVVCVHGMIKLVVCDTRDVSCNNEEIVELFIGERNPCLVVIPKGCYHGWKGIEGNPALVMNCPDKVYNYQNPDEHRLEAHDNGLIDYKWGRSDG